MTVNPKPLLKERFGVVVAIIVVFQPATSSAGASTDLNSDGNVDVSDVSLLIDIILGKN